MSDGIKVPLDREGNILTHYLVLCKIPGRSYVCLHEAEDPKGSLTLSEFGREHSHALLLPHLLPPANSVYGNPDHTALLLCSTCKPGSWSVSQLPGHCAYTTHTKQRHTAEKYWDQKPFPGEGPFNGAWKCTVLFQGFRVLFVLLIPYFYTKPWNTPSWV